jgi:hypothetical protein
MKNRLIGCLIALAIFAFITPSCNKDDDPKKSQIIYDGEGYELTKGYIVNFNLVLKAAPASYEFAVFLASDGVTMSGYNPPSGTGNWMGFWLYSSSPTEIVPGTYNFGSSEAVNTFDGEVMLESSYMMKLLPNTDIISGTLEIDVDSDEYTFTFEGTITGGDAVTAYYKGELTELALD